MHCFRKSVIRNIDRIRDHIHRNRPELLEISCTSSLSYLGEESLHPGTISRNSHIIGMSEHNAEFKAEPEQNSEITSADVEYCADNSERTLRASRRKLESYPSDDFHATGSSRRSRGAVWNHFESLIMKGENALNVPKVRCKACQQIVSPKVERLRRHILENHAELADKETEERFLASKEATKMPAVRSELDAVAKKLRKVAPVPAAAKSLTELTMKKDPEGKKALIWSYFQLLYGPGGESASGLKTIGAQCKICGTVVSPKIERLRRHFVNHHTDILIGGVDFGAQHISDTACNTTGSIEMSQDWMRKYFDCQNNQAQCRLCLNHYEPHIDSLYEHLKRSHDGILEFCDAPLNKGDGMRPHIHTPPLSVFEEYDIKKSIIQPPTTPEFGLDSPIERDAEHSSKRNGEFTSTSCFLCDRPTEMVGRRCSFSPAWQTQCGESLCQVFSLEQSYSQRFKVGSYCHACLQLIRNIDFTQRAINRLRSLLSSYRHSYENLLRKKYLLTNCKDTKQYEDDDNNIRNLYGAIFNEQTKSSFNHKRKSGLSCASPKSNRYRTLKRQRLHSSLNEEFEEKQVVVKYRSKYGRNCTSLSLQREWAEEDESDDIVASYDTGQRDEDILHPLSNSSYKYNSDNDIEELQLPESSGVNYFGTNPSQIDRKNSAPLSGLPLKKSKPRQKIVCSVPGCTFSSYQKAWLDVHIRSRHEHDELPYQCECGEKFGNMSSYGFHQRKHILESKKRAHCGKCQRSFTDKVALKAHREDAHKRPAPVNHKISDQQRCSFCSLVVGKDEALLEHEKLHEIKILEKLPYDCVLCKSQVFTNTMALQIHVKSMHNPIVEGPECDICKKVFKSVKILRRHNKRAHVGQASGSNWTCSDCGQSCDSRAEYRAHFKQHSKPRPFLCAECGMTFKSKSNLRIHTMLHTGERPWKCKICPKGFNQSSKLKAHEETHVEMKTYICDKCGKAFRTARNIYQHQKFHCHPDAPTRSQSTTHLSKKAGRERAQQRPGSDEDGSNASLSSISRPPRVEKDGEHFGQGRHHIGSLPTYLANAGSSLGEVLAIDSAGGATAFIGSHSHHVQGGCNVPIWISHGQQATLDPSHHSESNC